MKLNVSCLITTPGADLPLSHHFFLHLRRVIPPLIMPSKMLVSKLGDVRLLTVRIDLKWEFRSIEIRGPMFYRKDGEVEYVLTLPYGLIESAPDMKAASVNQVFDGVVSVLQAAEIDTSALESARDGLIQDILASPEMFIEVDRTIQVPPAALVPPETEDGDDLAEEVDHDPFDDPEQFAHPRARRLLKEEFFWDCVDEQAPFGSDEGWDAYFEFRRWRSEHPRSNLTKCLNWIMEGRLKEFTPKLCTKSQIQADLDDPDNAFLADHYDMFTLDATIIATALGQLIDEGKIDTEAKPYIRVAINRQLSPLVTEDKERITILKAIRRVIAAA